MTLSLESYYTTFLGIFLRTASFLLTLPLFSGSRIIHKQKVTLAFFISLILTPVFSEESDISLPLILWSIREICVGVLLAFFFHMFMGIVSGMGSILSYLIGFHMANAFSPETQEPSPLLSAFFVSFVSVLLLEWDVHHFLITVLAQSFQVVRPGTFILTPELTEAGFDLWSIMFQSMMLMLAPFLLLHFLVSTILGVLGRMIPQLNVFLTAQPAWILIIFLGCYVFLPQLVMEISKLYSILHEFFVSALGH